MADSQGARLRVASPCTLEQLISNLDAVTSTEGYAQVIRHSPIAPAALEPFCTWSPTHYTRRCLHRTERYELMLICYEPGQETSIHDYDSQKAWIKLIAGMVNEERFRIANNGKPELEELRTLTPGCTAHFATKECIHRHSNPGPRRAITLNLYVRPIRRWNVYDPRKGRASMKAGPTPRT